VLVALKRRRAGRGARDAARDGQGPQRLSAILQRRAGSTALLPVDHASRL
jgi:hypothetical protein